VAYALDVATEEVVERWFRERAAARPLSLLTEDAGWRHRGPDPDPARAGRSRELAGFDHGGPRVVIDPVDGTRNLIADLRPAWTVLAAAPPGAGVPLLSEATFGLVSELPDSRGGRFRTLSAVRGERAFVELGDVETGAVLERRELSTGDDARADHGYFTFFRYQPHQRPALAAIEAEFFRRLESFEGADVRTCFDDQYISSGGLLALVALGSHRLVADLRGWLAERTRVPAVPTKPYDLAGAVVVARAAGAVVDDPSGAELDVPLDCTTPVSFAAWSNAATRARLQPHFLAALG
jgi:fructose-1,6-bisphosphatase/inositol monophosphatase family enzyme